MKVVSTRQDNLTLEDVKHHLRVDWSDDDDYISVLVDASLEHAEDYCHRTLVPKTSTATLGSWSNTEATCSITLCGIDKPSYIKLVYDTVVVRTTALDYVRATGDGFVRITSGVNAVVIVELEGDAINYDPTSRCACIDLTEDVDGICVPPSGTVAVEWIEGEEAPSPNVSLVARKLFCGSMYEHRELQVVGTIASILPYGFTNLLDPLARSPW